MQQAAGSSPQQQPACVLLTCSSAQQAQEVWGLLQRHAQQQAVDVEAGEVSPWVAEIYDPLQLQMHNYHNLSLNW